MNNKKDVAQKLLQIKAIKFSPDIPFTWASGWKSPIYCDNRLILSYPFEREFIKSELCNAVFQTFPGTTLLAGVATAGIAWGAMVADQIKLPFIYARPKAKEHGLGNQIEGYYEKGAKVVVIEDLISTGKSSLQVIQALREAGLEILGLVSIFNYGFDIAKDIFSTAGVQVKSLTDYPALLDLAIESGLVGEEQQKILINWSANPSIWPNLV